MKRVNRLLKVFENRICEQIKTVNKLTLLFYLLFFLSVNLSENYAQGHNNTISGHVFNDKRQPVSNIYVELLNETNGVLSRVKTNSGGRYFFPGLSGGSFTIKVLPYGTDLEEQATEVNIATDGITGRSPSENVQQDFYLKLRRTAMDEKSLTGVVFVQDIPENAKKLYEKAVESLNKKNTDEGIVVLENALTAFPTYYVVLIRLGQEYGSLQKWTLAYETFKRAIAVNPKSFMGWYGLASAAKEAQMTDEAIKAAQEAVSILPSSTDAFLLLGLCQRKAKNYPEAEKTLKQANKLAKGKSPDIHWNLALLYAHNLSNFAGAANHLELYLKVKPDSVGNDDVKKLIKQFRQKASESN